MITFSTMLCMFIGGMHNISLTSNPCKYCRNRLKTEKTDPWSLNWYKQSIQQEVKVIWQKAPHGGPIPRLGVTPGGRKLYHWIPGVGFPISVP